MIINNANQDSSSTDNYNYVVVFSYFDIYDVYFEQVKEIDNAALGSLWSKSFPDIIIDKVLLSKKLHFLFPEKVRRMWLQRKVRKYGENFNNHNSICFILPLNYFRYNNYGMTEAIRDVFPDSKVVYFFTDLVSIIPERVRCATAENEADLLYTYDYKDAIEYNLKYHLLPYTDISSQLKTVECIHDVCFVGQAKNRLDRIIEVYEYLIQNDIDCDFYIVGASTQDKQYEDKIHYVKKFMSYRECLEVTCKSRCILEITQSGSTGHTPRVPEAIILNRKLLSNNSLLVKDDLYDSSNMMVFNKPEEISIEFLKDQNEICYSFDKNLLSPKTFFEDIEKELNTQEKQVAR